MRRYSPPRSSVRHRSPKRRGRERSLSPLSVSQPAPPGEESYGKKNSWDRMERPKRYRSRSREWMNRSHDPPYINLDDLESPKEKHQMKQSEKPRNRDRGRNFDFKEMKFHQHQSDFEESYLDNQYQGYSGNTRISKSHDNINILDPASINLSEFSSTSRSERKPHEKSRDSLQVFQQKVSKERNTLEFHPPRNDHNSPSCKSTNNTNYSIVKEESASDRIKRLEKLVEKLVEGNITKPKELLIEPPERSIPELIPCNTNFTTSMWLNMIHDECLQRHFDEKSVIRFLQDQMTGIIKAWYKTVANYDFTWPELKMLITKTFPDNTDFAQTLKLLVSKEKVIEETINQYFFSKLYLCEACKITGENAVSCIIDGLNNPFVKLEIKTLKFLTPEALYAEYLSKYPEHEIPVKIEHNNMREVVPDYSSAGEYIHLDTREESHFEQREQRGQSNLKKARKPESRDRIRCYTCNKFGHIAVDCRHAPICYKCKKKGHIAVKCSEK
ncbi:hypothetical protein ABEB36_001665 [Hypothenemus hampei]|uniref:CCHC-type domain-containing protein n=1 Tax=Hypothenemus hampei TaxID=57062 RepID=A0ABD1FFB4_HYPHA